MPFAPTQLDRTEAGRPRRRAIAFGAWQRERSSYPPRVSDERNDGPRRPRRDGPRDGAQREGQARPLIKARKVRSEFGTRVARKVVCSACGAEDTIHFAPRKDEAAMCRRCAADRLGVIDQDANIAPDRSIRCERCQMYVRKPCDFEDPLDCKEHARSLALRQKDRTRTAERTGGGVIRVRRPAKAAPPTED